MSSRHRILHFCAVLSRSSPDYLTSAAGDGSARESNMAGPFLPRIGWAFAHDRQHLAVFDEPATLLPNSRMREIWTTANARRTAASERPGYGYGVSAASITVRRGHSQPASRGQQVVDIGSNLRWIRIPFALPVAVYLPIWTSKLAIVGSTPLANCVVRGAQAAIRPEMVVHATGPAGVAERTTSPSSANGPYSSTPTSRRMLPSQ